MKNMSKKTKILSIIMMVIIIAGIIVIATKGFNFDLKYEKSQKLELYLEKNFEINDIKEITNEVMQGKQVIIQKVEVFEDTVSIIAKEITDEEKTNLISKINEKYGTELSADTTEIENIPHTRARDIMMPYVAPFIIATIIILAYMAVRYHKLGSIKTILKTIGINILAQAVLISIIAITRIPFGRLTIPMVLAIYLLTMIGITAKFEKNLLNKKEEDKEEEKKEK